LISLDPPVQEINVAGGATSESMSAKQADRLKVPATLYECFRRMQEVFVGSGSTSDSAFLDETDITERLNE